MLTTSDSSPTLRERFTPFLVELLMSPGELPPVSRCFADVEDPRTQRKVEHLLTDIITIVVCAGLCGIDDFEHSEEFANHREVWFRKFLTLEHGIPSHDTMNRVFQLVDSRQFETGFIAWMKDVTRLTDGEIVAIDGKTLRGSFDRASSRAAIHMLSAWASANGVVLGQVQTDQKSNEIMAIPRLLDLLDVRGCLITLDAMGCQRAIAEKIVEKGADYTISLKGNQSTLHEDVIALFESAKQSGAGLTSHKTSEKGHGREEMRRFYLCDAIAELQAKHEWPGLKSVGLVQTTRIVNGVTGYEDRYFVNSHAGDVKRFADAARKHWGVENNLHWCLDVTLGGDSSRVRKDHAVANLSIVRRTALNLLRKDPSKGSLRKKQLRCLLSEEHLN